MIMKRLGMPVCLLMAASGLFLFGRHVWHSGGRQTEMPGITVKSEILIIYAPRALITFAETHPEIATNDELVRLIREEQPSVWFAVGARNYQADGIVANVEASYRPGEMPEYFDTTKAVLRTLAGNPPGSGAVDYTKAKIVVMEDTLMELEPVEGLRRLLGR
jgi:hypothetical protein